MTVEREPTRRGAVIGTVGYAAPEQLRGESEVAPVSDALAAIVHKALAADRDERYADVLTMLHDVESLMQGGKVSALEESPIERGVRWYLARTPRVARFRTIDED